MNIQVRPQFSETLAIQAGRHPIKEKIQKTKFIPNDVYSTQQTRFQIITGVLIHHRAADGLLTSTDEKDVT